MEAQSGKRSLPTPSPRPRNESGKTGIQTQALTAPRPLQSPHTLKELHLRRRTQMSPSHNFAALTFPRTLLVTSLFAMKRNKAVWVGQRKPPAAMSNKPGVICFYSFPCDCWRLSWFLLAQTSPFQKIIL